MDRLQRIYKLHQIIAAHHLPVPHSVLQEKLECSRATVNRIIEEMCLYFNAPIEFSTGQSAAHRPQAENGKI